MRPIHLRWWGVTLGNVALFLTLLLGLWRLASCAQILVLLVVLGLGFLASRVSRCRRLPAAPYLIQKKDAGAFLFATIGLLLVDFEYLSLLYSRQGELFGALDRDGGSVDLENARLFAFQNLSLLVGGLFVFLALIAVFDWITHSQQILLNRHRSKALRSTSEAAVRSSESLTVASEGHTASVRKAQAALAICTLLRLTILVIFCLHTVPIIEAASLVEQRLREASSSAASQSSDTDRH